MLSDLGVKRSPIGTVGYNKLLEIVEQTCNDPLQLFLDLQRYNPHTRKMRTRLEESLRAGSCRPLTGNATVDMPGGPR